MHGLPHVVRLLKEVRLRFECRSQVPWAPTLQLSAEASFGGWYFLGPLWSRRPAGHSQAIPEDEHKWHRHTDVLPH